MEEERRIRSLDSLERFAMYMLIAAAIVVIVLGVATRNALVGCGLSVIPLILAYLLGVKSASNKRQLADIPRKRRERHLRLNEAINGLAKEFDCTTVEDEAGIPSFVINHGSQAVQFQAANDNLLIRSSLPMGKLRLFVWPNNQITTAFRNVVDTPIGDSDFDWRFVIQTNEPKNIASVLTQSLRRQLTELADLAKDGPMGFGLNGGEVLITIPLPEPPNWEAARTSLAILESLQKQSGVWSGTTIDKGLMDILPGKTPDRDQVSCLVCGDIVIQQKVICRQCKTPHHRECWDYIGKCSVFGCGSRKYRT